MDRTPNVITKKTPSAMTNIKSEFFFPHSIILFVSCAMSSDALPLAEEDEDDGGGFVFSFLAFSFIITFLTRFESSSPTLMTFELNIPGLSNNSSRKISDTMVL